MGFEKEDEVIGLMMYLGDDEDLELVEHLLVKNRSKCFDMKEDCRRNIQMHTMNVQELKLLSKRKNY